MKEFLKDVGKRIIGRGEQVRFKNEATQYERIHGVTHEAAEKTVLEQRITDVQHEFTLTGTLDARANPNVKRLQAAFRETMGDQLEQCQEDARALPALVAPPRPRVYSATQKYFQTHFAGAPNNLILQNATRQVQGMNQALTIFVGDTRLGGPQDLAILVSTFRDLGATLGQFLNARETFQRHERQFKREQGFEASVEDLKASARENLTMMLYRAPVDFGREIVQGAVGLFSRRFDRFFNALAGTFRFAGRELWAATKLAGSALKTSALYLNTKRG